MATEFKLSYTGSQINEKLNKIDGLAAKSELPTKTSQLTNDSGYMTSYTETDPTVPEWAKQPKKPTYTAKEVGALAKEDLQGGIDDALAQAKASGEFDGKDGQDGSPGADGKDGVSATHSWNGTVLTITSASGTSSADLKGAKGDQGEKGADGANGKDGTSVTVKSVSESIADEGSNVVTFSDGKAVTIKNGKQGSDGKTPVRGVDYYTEADKEEFLGSVNAVRYVAQNLTEAQKAQARANIGATAGDDVEFAESVEWLNENGDTSKKYVLPDGYIYAYTEKHVKVAHNANDGTGFLNMRPTGSPGSNKDANTAKNGLFVTAPIPVDGTWSSATLNISGLEKLVPTFYASLYVYYFNASGTYIAYCGNSQLFPPGSNTVLTPGNAEVEITLPVGVDLKKDANGMGYFSQSSYIRVAVGVHKTAAISDADIENLVINIDRLNKEETVYGWYSTGQQHSNDKVTQQNSADILALKEDVEALKESVSTTPGGSGAVWYAIGDSITYGLYSTSASDYSQPVVGKRWVDYVAQFNGYKLTNLGKSGSGFVTGTTFRAIVDGNNFADVDLVTIMLGINDWKNEAAVNKVGTMDDSVGTTYTDKIIPELRYGIEKIIGQNPYCKIILITPINAKIGSRGTESTNWAYGFGGSITPCGSLKNFGDKLKEVCEYYGIQVIDMTNSSIVNRKSITTVLPDGIHPNLDCYKALGLELARRITFA